MEKSRAFFLAQLDAEKGKLMVEPIELQDETLFMELEREK